VRAIVNLTTVAVPLRLEGEAIYAASKAAVESLTRITAKEVGAWASLQRRGADAHPHRPIAKVPSAKLDALVAQQAIRRGPRWTTSTTWSSSSSGPRAG
jgi:3-oxoacyl-[acyl-carrier protein] reductase